MMAASSSTYKNEPNDHDSDEEDPKECCCSVAQDEDKDIEIFLNAKLEEAKKELEYTVTFHGILQDIKLNNLTPAQQRRQNDILASMFRYIIYLEDLKSRKGRCKFCVKSENAY